jgi:hypothetical protein
MVHCMFLFKAYSVSETGFYLLLQLKSTQLGPIDRTSPCLREPASTQDWLYTSQAQHKPSARAKAKH